MRLPLPTSPRSGSQIAALLALAAATTGCGPASLGGTWEGSCLLTDGRYGQELFLEADLRPHLFGDAEGEGEVVFLGDEVIAGGIFPAEVTASRAGASALFTFAFRADAGAHVLELEGTRDGPELEGDCALWVPDATGPVLGLGELSR